MEEHHLIEYLMCFGLTRQESLIYLELFQSGICTGYEISNSTGISRSNVYKTLAGLADKGAAYVQEGTSRKYAVVKIEEFCQNKIRNLVDKKQYLLAHLPKEKEEAEGYITIASDDNISDKVKSMLETAKKRVYLSMSVKLLENFYTQLKELTARNIKIVILTDTELQIGKVQWYQAQNKGSQIGLIVDSRYVLTGELGNGKESTCLYTGQANFVQVFKDSMKNEIRLLELGADSRNIEDV